MNALGRASLRQSKTLFNGGATRQYGNVTQECKDHLAKLGITNKNIVFNPS